MRYAVPTDWFADMVRKANVDLDQKIRTLSYTDPVSSSGEIDCKISEVVSIDLNEFSSDYCSEPLTTSGPSSATPECVASEDQSPVISSRDGSRQLPAVGDNVSVYQRADNRYYSGEAFTVEDGHHTILYNDGDVERQELYNETCVSTVASQMTVPHLLSRVTYRQFSHLCFNTSRINLLRNTRLKVFRCIQFMMPTDFKKLTSSSRAR